MDNEIMNNVIYIVMSLAIVIVTRYLVPYLKARLSAANQEELIQLIENLVQAAEQIFTQAKSGEQKKQYVVKALAEKGISITESTNALIESAVYNLDN